MNPLAVVLVVVALIWTQPLAAQPHGFAIHPSPQDLAEITFTDGAGDSRTLADWRGRTVLVNVWATWCVPCRTEMPTLDNLQATLGGERFAVLALSIDRAGAEAVRRFYDEIGIANLEIAVDPTGRAAIDLRVVGLPTTILVDPAGKEVGRLIGPAEWDSAEMLKFLLNASSPWKERDLDNVVNQ